MSPSHPPKPPEGEPQPVDRAELGPLRLRDLAVAVVTVCAIGLHFVLAGLP